MEYIVKATRAKEEKPHKVYNQHANRMYAYVGHIILGAFFKPGAIFRRAEIMNSSRGVSKPFKYGDILVKYTTGSLVVIDKRQLKSGQKKPCFRSATPDEQQAIKHIMPLVERELKWRKNSYCEDDTRQNHRTQQHYCWTSNAEAKRRAKYKIRNKQYYYDRKKKETG